MIHKIRMTGRDDNFEEVRKQMYAYQAKQDKSKYRPLFLVLGGGQVGVYSGGGVAALEKLGLNSAFKYAVGISTGAPVVSYFLAKQARLGSTIYYKENTGKEFVNFSKLYSISSSNNYILDIEWLCKIFNGEIFNKKLDVESFKKSNTEAYYVATNATEFTPELLDAKKLKNPVDGIHASCAVPTLYNQHVPVGKKKYIDGDTAAPFPISMLIKKFKPTSILVFANRIDLHHHDIVEKYIVDYVMKRHLAVKSKSLVEEKAYLETSGIPYTIIWTDSLVTSGLETNPQKLKLAAKRFYSFVLRNFEK